jgi:glycosyltransferase involved in cell wall biosynthesis
MRLAIDMRSVAETGGQISGVENYFVNIFNRLPSVTQKGVRIFPVINRYKEVILPEGLALPSALRQTRMPNKFFNSLEFLIHRPQFESIYGNFDVLWLPDIRPFSVAKKAKVALTVHDLSPLTNPEYYSMRRRIWHRIADYRRAIARADIIFAVSEYTKQDIVKKLHTDPEKIKVIHPGVDMHRFKALHKFEQSFIREVRTRYALPEQYILALSTVEPRKNIANLVVAFENCDAAHTGDMHLVIAGKLGWLYQPILDRIAASPLKNKIHVIGYVHESDKAALLASASVLCYPSFHEGFGFQPLEAMASAVPVVAAARTSIPEVCGDAALLVEPNHPEDIAWGIDMMLHDSVLRETYIKKGLERAKNFDWQETAKQVYDGCMQIAKQS